MLPYLRKVGPYGTSGSVAPEIQRYRSLHKLSNEAPMSKIKAAVSLVEKIDVPGHGSNLLGRKLQLEQNRLSAQRSRKRKKILIEELQRTTYILEDEYKQLQAENLYLTAEYEREKRMVRFKMMPISDDVSPIQL